MMFWQELSLCLNKPLYHIPETVWIFPNINDAPRTTNIVEILIPFLGLNQLFNSINYRLPAE